MPGLVLSEVLGIAQPCWLLHTRLVQVMNALEMEFEDDTFDLVWACESGEHMPDKAKYVQEMTRVLKPGVPLHAIVWHLALWLPRLPWC